MLRTRHGPRFRPLPSPGPADWWNLRPAKGIVHLWSSAEDSRKDLVTSLSHREVHVTLRHAALSVAQDLKLWEAELAVLRMSHGRDG